MIIIILATYILLEATNYIKYCVQYAKLNNFIDNKNIDHEKICIGASTITLDTLNHIKNITNQFMDLFFHNTNIDKISYENALSEITHSLYYPINTKHINNIHTKHIINKIESINSIKLNVTNTIQSKNNNLITWYTPLPIIILKYILAYISRKNLKKLGFTKITLENKINLWIRSSNLSNNAIIFFHASLGGLLVYNDFFKNLSLDKTIILPEIPGVAYGNDLFIPPTIYEISRCVTEHIKNNNYKKIDLIGHSFGCNFVSCIINRFPEINIDKTIIIEGFVFLPRISYIYKFFNDNGLYGLIKAIKYKNYGELLSIPFFYRDLYLQFYMKRCIKASENILLGNTSYENNSKNIYVIFSKNDSKIFVDEVINYIKSKKYNYNIKVFENKKHGDFAFCENMQKYVLNILKN